MRLCPASFTIYNTHDLVQQHPSSYNTTSVSPWLCLCSALSSLTFLYTFLPSLSFCLAATSLCSICLRCGPSLHSQPSSITHPHLYH